MSTAHGGPQHLLKSKHNIVWKVKLKKKKKHNYTKLMVSLGSPLAEVDIVFKLNNWTLSDVKLDFTFLLCYCNSPQPHSIALKSAVKT